ncbi:DUF1822 family protein [Spirulina sp. CCNP1310]|uniref:DUF1822 family protein n=1 Tax=Spirulina sp. CCNP1310 TaxID=3110249 RepID=UPI002B21A3A3|nr:DUF1822 family protein [Spirulina sp. CCNP1310]MEA5418206.1 DUF1822 family protein [Spirulina sp. CCNP1310]
MPAQPQPLILDIAPGAIASAETLMERQSTPLAAWQAYHHQIALETLMSWLQTHRPEAITPWLPPSEQPAFWEGVGGAALQWGEVRLALFATETEDLDTWLIPQEWVDLPAFVADYYLAVELHLEPDPAESWLAVVGYATHGMVREGHRNEERCYCLDRQAFIPDLYLLFLGQRLFGRRWSRVSAVPQFLPAVQAQLLQDCVPVTEPRLGLPFEQWGSLFSVAAWRSQLYRERMEQASFGPRILSLGRWLKQRQGEIEQAINQGWQSLEEIAQNFHSSEMSLAYRFGGDYRLQTGSWFPDAVPGVVEVLRSAVDKETQLSAIYLLGQIGQGDGEAIAALVAFQASTTDADLRRQAAVSLGKIDPSHPAAGIRRGKVLDLGLQVGESPVVLVLTLLPEGEKTNIQMRLNPIGDRATLPPDIQLIIEDGEGVIFQEVRSRGQDQALQLALRANGGDRFTVVVVFGDHQVRETFQV